KESWSDIKRLLSIKGKERMNDTYISEEILVSVRELSSQTPSSSNHDQVTMESFEVTTSHASDFELPDLSSSFADLYNCLREIKQEIQTM
ncbi:1792_t:CDS:1, partial [Ambispora leptoticha]